MSGSMLPRSALKLALCSGNKRNLAVAAARWPGAVRTLSSSARSHSRKPHALPLSSYPTSFEVQTRWCDNDIYRHANNALYMQYMDTAVNRYLIRAGALVLPTDPAAAARNQSTAAAEAAAIGLVVENGCSYFAPVAFPETLTVAVRVPHIGRSSVRYELGIFNEGESDSPAAQGFFIHVYVDPLTRKPVKALPDMLRRALEPLMHTPLAADASQPAAGV